MMSFRACGVSAWLLKRKRIIFGGSLWLLLFGLLLRRLLGWFVIYLRSIRARLGSIWLLELVVRIRLLEFRQFPIVGNLRHVVIRGVCVVTRIQRCRRLRPAWHTRGGGGSACRLSRRCRWGG